MSSGLSVGFVGTGNMGGPMCSNLLRSGVATKVFVYARSPEKVQSLVDSGATLVSSVGELAQADIVCSCLSSVQASLDIFLGSDGLINKCKPGHIFIDHGTVDLTTTKQCANPVVEKGAVFLDAPVSGGPEGAKAATLSIMVGGTPEGFERALPVLRAMGKTVERMGPSGAGTTTKLVNQLLVGIHSIASAEAACLATRAGVDMDKLSALLSESWGGSRILPRNFGVIQKGEESLLQSGAPIRNLAKDLDCVHLLAEELKAPLPFTEHAREVYRGACNDGMPDSDPAMPFVLLERSGQNSSAKPY